jgi:RNA polymerase sigma-70 factor (ECF subfamily)
MKTGLMDEDGLIRAACQGDLEAFNQLVLNYQELAYRKAYAVLRNRDAALDITQDALIQAYQNLLTYRGGSFRSWLLRIVTHASVDELRRWQRQPLFFINPMDVEGDEVETPPWLVDAGLPVEEVVEWAEFGNLLSDSLKELPGSYRSVVFLVDVLELDYGEVANILEIPRGTVKSRLARARMRLRRQLLRTPELVHYYSGLV